MLIRTAAVVALSLGTMFLLPAGARADDLCKPGHVIDSGRNVCYDPATAYRPNVPVQQPLLGSGPSANASPGNPAPASPSSGGIMGWLSDQARFCRFGDRQVGNGDAAYCVDRAGKSYPAGK